jgi:hypothetical protein
VASSAVQMLEKSDILRAAKSFRPARKLQKWVVIVNGREFPARPLLLHAAGVAPNDPTNSHQAVAKLQELGFETRYAHESAQERVKPAGESDAELRWLGTNGQAYAGQWVALQGERLLAAGPDAREVFFKVRHLSPPPLVIQVQEQRLPFAGW